MSEPDFEKLRAERNRRAEAWLDSFAREHKLDRSKVRSSFNPEACYCNCPEGPCEHKWDGEPYQSDDGCGWSRTCSRCDCTAMSHDMRVAP